MTCKHAMENLLSIDNHASPDTATQEHLEQCPRCRVEYERLTRAFALLRRPDAQARSAGAPDRQLTQAIMSAVHAATARNEPVDWADYGKWITSGVLILVGMLALPYTGGLAPLRAVTDTNIDVTLAITFGFVVSGYMALLIGTHLDDLRRRIRRTVSRS